MFKFIAFQEIKPLRLIKKSKGLFFCFVAFLPVDSRPSAPVEAEWNFLIFMQARNNLAPFAKFNLDAIASSVSSSRVRYFVQWDQPKKPGSWRYEVLKDQIKLANFIETEDPQDMTKKLVDFVKWANVESKAKHTCLVFWNHGLGVVDPIFGKSGNGEKFCPNTIRSQESAQAAFQSRDFFGFSDEEVSLIKSDIHSFSNPIAEQRIQLSEFESQRIFKILKDLLHSDAEQETRDGGQRGILFDDENRAYMTTQDLESALKQITSSQVLGKKIDVVGFDACFMANFETLFQIKDYAKFCVASEDLELPKGWNYAAITKSLSDGGLTPAELSKTIVRAFKDFYNGQTNMYTQTSIDLAKIDSIKHSLDDVISLIETSAREDRALIAACLSEARRGASQMTAKVFVDLQSFCQSLIERIKIRISALDNGFKRSFSIDALNRFVGSVEKVCRSIDESVCEHTASSFFARMKGLSVYFPTRNLESSYANCRFAIESKWMSLIKSISIF